MGAFFTNVQVLATDTRAIADALRADASERGYDELAPDSTERPDRTVLVLPPEQGWIAIYDEATEGQDAKSLEAIARAASRAAASHAFTVTIHDNDILYLSLFERGERIDRLDSDPTYYGSVKPSKEKRRSVAGNADRWLALVGDDESRRVRLTEAFRSDALFAESMLREVCDVVGVDPSRASTGYRYTTSGYEPLPDDAITLRFRLRTRPGWETTSDAPPELVAESYQRGEIQLAVGDEVRCSLGARSAGRASKGLAIVTWGSALAKGLITVDRFELVIGNMREGAKHEMITPRDAQSAKGEPMRAADLPDAEIPAGSAEPFAGFAPGMDIMKAMEAAMRSKVHVNVVGRAVAVGRGELGIGLTPLERTEASAGSIVELAVDPPMIAPLRARDGIAAQRGNPSHLFRPLTQDSQLVAMIGFDTRAALATATRAFVESVRTELGDGDKTTTATFFAEGGKRPKTGNGKAKTMLHGKRFDALIEAAEREQMVTLEAGPFALSAGTTLIATHESERVPWLAVSIAAEGRDVESIRSRWSDLVDDAMGKGTALQAFLARAGWRAHQNIGQTPYETACSMAHDVGTLRKWIERWVRTPSNDRLWISRTLADRLDPLAVATVADREDVGSSVRLTLRDRSKWFEFEEALAPLLATAEQSMEMRPEIRR